MKHNNLKKKIFMVFFIFFADYAHAKRVCKDFEINL